MEVMNDAQAVQRVVTHITASWTSFQERADGGVTSHEEFHAFFEGMEDSLIFMGLDPEIWWEAFDTAFDL